MEYIQIETEHCAYLTKEAEVIKGTLCFLDIENDDIILDMDEIKVIKLLPPKIG